MKNVLNFGASTLNPITLFFVGSVDSSQPHYVEMTYTGEINQYTFTSNDATAGNIRVTLSYTDYFGVSGCM